ncbi:MAG: TonB-dependent receptor plug domain-containing protein [Leptospiraceae bacterium]|nr:TonB-dependent receptor plug domain-containing protein [Leptospiraceae bacterium]MDW8306617.1 TonB-dependent receptor plug domain-containing protein [Leptospiraceae bacterium]
MKRWVLFLLLVPSAYFFNLWAQALTVEGVIYDDYTKKPVGFAVLVIPEAKISRRIAGSGAYSVVLPGPGTYTFNISSPGLRPISRKIEVKTNLKQDFYLEIAAVKGETIVVRTTKEIQKVSRNTLDVNQIKEAPATLGDSIGALATLPGVIRSGGFFGPLIIRGAPEIGNRYFIDDIPVLNPQHFGGLQSVISNDLIQDIDLYSSSFPAQFGLAYGAVIDINTIDNVEEFGGNIDIGLISSNFLLKNKWGHSATGDVRTASETQENKSKNTGYWIVSGRLGYLSLVVPVILRVVTGQREFQLPEYYDYQLKGKWFFDEQGKHAITLLFFGSYDTFRFIRENLSPEEKQKRIEEGADPLGSEFRFQNRISSHSQGIYYTYRPSSKLENKLIAYNSLNYSLFYIDILDKPPGLDNSYDVSIEPHVFGLKDKILVNWSDFGQLRSAVEYNLFYFRASGYTQTLRTGLVSRGQPDIGNPNLFQRVNLDFQGQNHLISGYLENRFRFGSLEITPGVRTDYLERTRTATTAPRGLVAYEFPSKTTLAAAGGLYYSFPQTNQFFFNRPFVQQPQVVVTDYLKPERARHTSLSLEQVFDLLSIKIEGFYNEFYDLARPLDGAANNGRIYDNSGRGRAQGIEIFLRKDQWDTQEAQFFGWASYTYSRSQVLENGKWRPFEFEQPHSIKLIGGFRWRGNQIGARFEFFSGFPYTEIIGSQCTPGFACAGGPNPVNRYSQIYDLDNPYAKRFPFAHRLDLRYTRITNYSWGSFRWYIEVINVYNYVPINQQRWNYNRPYEPGVNPKVQRNEQALSLIPNFGLEWRF